MEAWVTWAIQGAVALVFMLGAAYVRSIVNDLKGKIADNKKGVSDNKEEIDDVEDKISDGKKEIYRHLEQQYYTKETMDAKVIALKYRSDKKGDPNTTI